MRLARTTTLFGLLAPLAVGLLVVPSAAHAQSFMTPGFKLGESRPKTLVVLPPHANFIKAKVVMTDQMIAESHALEDHAAQIITGNLRERGYAVHLLAIDQINADPELQELVRRLNDRYDEEWSRMVRSPRQVRTGRYEAGEDAIRLASRLEVDGVVMARIIAVYVSGGRKTFAMVFSLGASYPRSYTRVDLSIVDGGSGEIESYCYEIELCKSKTLTRKPDKIMGTAYRKCLATYPGMGEVLEVGEAELARLEMNDSGDNGDSDDESVLSDFEALLASEEACEEKEEKPDGS